MVIIMLGAPGTGKGTQSKLLSKYYQIPHISTGDLLRDVVEKGGEDAKEIKDYMDKGLLIPDEKITELLEKVIKSDDAKKGFILDGYPRTVSQADALGKTLKKNKMPITAVINLETPEDEIVKRITNRLVCTNCKAIYNEVTAPPISEGICDVCDTKLVKRSDDTEEKIRKRLKEYKEKSYPLLGYYERTGKLFKVLVTEQVKKNEKEVLKEIIWFIEKQ